MEIFKLWGEYFTFAQFVIFFVLHFIIVCGG